MGFALAHVLGLLVHRPAPYSGTLTMAAILAAVWCTPAPSRRLLCGLAALTTLAWSVDARGDGFGWPAALAQPATGPRGLAEAALLLGGGIALLGVRMVRLRIGIVALVVLSGAALPLWVTGRLQLTGDRIGLLTATVPLLVVVVLGVFAADRALSFAYFSGTGAAGATALAGLAAVAVWYRADDDRFAPVYRVHYLSPSDGSRAQLTIDAIRTYATDGTAVALAPDPVDWLRSLPATSHAAPAPTIPPAPAPTWSDDFWTAQFSWAEVSTAVAAMVCVAAVIAVAMAGHNEAKAGA